MKDCINCGNYNAYYSKDRDHFKRERQGFCDLDKKVVQNHDTCERWRNNYWRRTVRNRVCVKTLDKALTTISEIKQILFEEQGDNKDNPFPSR